MVLYPNQPLLTEQQILAPSGDTFLLPVCLNSAQLNTLLSMYELGMWSLYERTNPELDLSGVWPVLEAMAFIDNPGETSCGAEFPEGEGCNNHLPDVGFIEYAPNDPFQTPTFVPPGYLLPPFYNNPTIPLPGVIPTDAMVNFAAFPLFASIPDMLASGLPRCRISFSGTGELEIEFVGVPQGGYALCVVDGNPLVQKVFDLNAYSITDASIIEDIFDIVVGQALNSTVTAEFQFDTAGDHFVDVTFLPQLSADTVLGFGGGIRRVSLCEGLQIGETIMPQMQVVGECEIQWRPSPSHAWVTLIANACGADGLPGTDGIDGQDGASVELRIVGDMLQWRQDDNTPTWADLYDLSTLQGDPGVPGTDGQDGQDGQDGLGFTGYYLPEQRCRVAQSLVNAWRDTVFQAISLYETQIGAPAGFEWYANYWASEMVGSNLALAWGEMISMDATEAADLKTKMGFNHASRPDMICIVYELLPVDLQLGLPLIASMSAALKSYMSANSWTNASTDMVGYVVSGSRPVNLTTRVISGLMSFGDTTICGACLPNLDDMWGMSWLLSANSASGAWEITNGTWISGAGWRQAVQGGTPLSFECDFFVSGFRVQFGMSAGDRVLARLYDVATSRELARLDTISSSGGTETLDWSGEVMQYAEQGVRLFVEFFDINSNSSLNNVVFLCITGYETEPTGGLANSGCV